MSTPTLSLDGSQTFVLRLMGMPRTGVFPELLNSILNCSDIEQQANKWPPELNDTTIQDETSRCLDSRTNMRVSRLDLIISMARYRVTVLQEGQETFRSSVGDFKRNLRDVDTSPESLKWLTGKEEESSNISISKIKFLEEAIKVFEEAREAKQASDAAETGNEEAA